jgi:cell division protease FtsH
MRRRTRFNIWYILLAIFLILVIQHVIFSLFRPEVIPFSDFINAVLDDKVSEIAESEDHISGKMKQVNGDIILFKTVRVETDLAKKLAKHNVKFSGQVENKFFKTLLSWLVPILLILSLWFFLMRRLQSDTLTFGKNKARIVGEKDIPTRFDDVAGAEEAQEELWEIIDFLEMPYLYKETLVCISEKLLQKEVLKEDDFKALLWPQPQAAA